MYCICCEKDNVSPFDIAEHKSEIDMIWENKKISMNDGSTQTRTINNAMVGDGIIHIIDAGYGSKHDGDRIIIAICDDCITKKLEEATLLYYDNYMFTNDNHINNEISKSKKLYKRRKNLDSLIK